MLSWNLLEEGANRISSLLWEEEGKHPAQGHFTAPCLRSGEAMPEGRMEGVSLLTGYS